MHRDVDVAIVGAGTAGLSALSQVRKVTGNFVLINGGALGTTCARVGCMPSKAAIQVAEDFHRRGVLDRCGIEGGQALRLDVPEAMEHVRELRDIFVDRVLAGSTDELGQDQLLEGYARFVEPNVLDVEGQTIRAKRVVIATGSCPYVPTEWERFGERILTTDHLFEQERLPESVAVIGLGVIGLEMGQTLHRMGVQVTGIDRLQTIGGLKDPAVSEAAAQAIGSELPLWLGHEAQVEPGPDGRLRVSAGEHSVVVDKLLVSMGRVPNLQRLDLARLGVTLDERGIPAFDRETMQVGELPVFIAGDATGERPILHEAGDEGRIAGYNAVHEPVARFRRKTPLAITFCDPTVATVGSAWDELDPERIAVGEMRLGPVGRALIMGKNKGMIRLYADRSDGRLLGAALAAPRGEDLAHLLAWSTQQGLTAADLLKMPYYHPTIEEALQAALRDLRRNLGLQDELPELERLA
ncbi:MAG: dihydrolipoyl dehydrogenase [Gammaproteobacteria bacterium]|nr:dihydrolipoyl dehydrogenase [Gammaproteobacteria bacterium]NIR98880.1 dihydrolipoyl dehydrogenase [Gammaproteobacteria bacterium]NIT64001.1 dihydrolipoyl dehydrogenase [Gammaproteobacteria bacterium]NIV19161.1 dihydrolipoyl dehydrogenase [Gammaproteobacteria bacterium]NIX10330.1 dihydrolipoyl dehydrogenase [Gammaproteobacteria bacterium]